MAKCSANNPSPNGKEFLSIVIIILLVIFVLFAWCRGVRCARARSRALVVGAVVEQPTAGVVELTLPIAGGSVKRQQNNVGMQQ